MQNLAPEISHKLVGILAPKYDWVELVPEEDQTRTIPNVGSTGYNSFVIDGTNVINASRSRFLADYFPQAAALKANWTRADTTIFQEVRLDTEQGKKNIFQQTQSNYITHAVQKYLTKETDMLGYPIYASGVVDTPGKFLMPNNYLADAGNSQRPDGTDADRSYIETAYIQGASAVNTAEPHLYIDCPLSQIRHSLLELDKNLYFGQNIILKFIYDAAGHLYWTSTDKDDPDATDLDYTGSATIQNVRLLLCIETNQQIIDEYVEQYSKGGNIVWFEVTRIDTQGGNTTSNNKMSLSQITPGDGLRCKMIYSILYDGTETGNNKFNNSNLAQAKYTSIQTKMNQKTFLQQNPMLPANGDDYSRLRDSIAGSCIISQNIFQYNSIWVDNWCTSRIRLSDRDSYFWNSKTDGFDITQSNSTHLTTYIAVGGVAQLLMKILVFSRSLKLSSEGIEVN